MIWYRDPLWRGGGD